MLQRQPWLLPHPRSPIVRSIQRTQQARFHRRFAYAGCNSVQDSNATPSYQHHSIRMGLIQNRKPLDIKIAARRHGTRLASSRSRLRSAEQWINPGSLSESLDAHRRANRQGYARDGVPNEPWKIPRTPQRIDLSPNSRGKGLSVLRPSMLQSMNGQKSIQGGRCPPILSEWRSSGSLPRELRLPWLSNCDPEDLENTDMIGVHRLEIELQGCGKWLSPSDLEQIAAENAFSELDKIIRQLAGYDVCVKLIGSRAAGTPGPVSDMDVYVGPVTEAGDGDRTGPESFLRELEKGLRQARYNDVLMVHTYLKRAKVPIVIGTHLASGLEFQLQSSATAHDSLEVSKAYVAEYALAGVIFKIVKQILTMRGLTKADLGGITSYPLLNMVVVSLKLAGPQHILTEYPIASQLLHFCKFWSEFNFEKDRISYAAANEPIDPISTTPKILPRNGQLESNVGHMLLEDPADLKNNLGRNAQGIGHIQACLIEVHSKLQQALQQWDRMSVLERSSYQAKGLNFSLLRWCLEGDYTSFGEARWQLQRYAQRLMNS